MESSCASDIETIIAELKSKNHDAIQLFEEESQSSLLTVSTSPIINSNKSRSNLVLIDTYMHQVENKLDELDIEVLKWKVLRESLEILSTENVAIKKSYLQETRRTQSLYHSLNDAITSQMAQETQLQDLKLKYKTLTKEHKKLQNQKSESDTIAPKDNEKYSGLLNGKKKSVREENPVVSKKQKIGNSIEDSQVATSSSKPKRVTAGKAVPQHNLITPWTPEVVANSSSDSNSATAIAASSSHSEQQVKNETTASLKKAALETERENMVHRKIKKSFKGHGIFIGTVTAYKSPYFSVVYQDNDGEEFTETELLKYLVPLDA